jgi:hypothetical protein
MVKLDARRTSTILTLSRCLLRGAQVRAAACIWDNDSLSSCLTCKSAARSANAAKGKGTDVTATLHLSDQNTQVKVLKVKALHDVIATIFRLSWRSSLTVFIAFWKFRATILYVETLEGTFFRRVANAFFSHEIEVNVFTFWTKWFIIANAPREPCSELPNVKPR